jgi:DNA-binding NarL/FixJ family response regulator
MVNFMEMIRLFIIEDQPSILKNQVKILGSFDNIDIVGTASSGEEAIDEIHRMDQYPQVVLCDLGLPIMSGIEVTKRIKSMHNRIEVLIFTIFEDENKVLKAIRAGASGYLLKGTDITKIHEAIVDVFAGGTVIQPSLARKLLKYFAMPLEGTPPELLGESLGKGFQKKALLSIRELECLQIIAKGLSNHEAACVLNLSKATIRTHLEHVYQKLDVTNRVEAITEAIRQGIIDL